jgi:hypothetical protein
MNDLERRLIGCLPAATFEMETFCRLAGVQISDHIPTAAVECISRPRLLLNPQFIAKYCQRDEHLFLLVMHELWHIILAHTRMYPRMTQAQNIAFDAIINATLSRQFSGPEYHGFFDVLNAADKFPNLLLRPPVGWPHDPQYVDGGGPDGTLQIMQRLYPRFGGRWQPPLYEEILQLLRQHARDKGTERVLIDSEPTLLGDHSDHGKQSAFDPTLESIMKRVVGKWPQSPMPLRTRGDGADAQDWFQTNEETSEQARRAFSHVLKQTLISRPGRETRRTRQTIQTQSGSSVLPNARDRTIHARRSLGAPDTLWAAVGPVRTRVPDTPSKTHLYLDVSGSMGSLLPRLLGLITPYVHRQQVDVFQFSTKVEPLPLEALAHGKLKTTMGTNINCVLKHALEFKPAISKLLVVTDGAVGRIDQRHATEVQARGLRIYVVLPHEAANKRDLEAIAAAITVLPPLR